MKDGNTTTTMKGKAQTQHSNKRSALIEPLGTEAGMAEKDTSNWNIYDWLDVAEYSRWKRRCPKCGKTDVKYAVHSKAICGFELSVCCNDCKHYDSGNNSGYDAERMMREWHEST